MPQAGTAGQRHFTVQVGLGGYRCVGAVSGRGGHHLTLPDVREAKDYLVINFY